MDFLEYLEGAEQIIIHNADFDLGFLIYEYSLLGLGDDFLDALCKRFGVGAEDRVLHGALLYAKLLAQLYLSIIAIDSQCSLFGETPEFTPSDENIIQNFEDYILPMVLCYTKRIF